MCIICCCQAPNFKLILQKQETGNYCAAEPNLRSLTPNNGTAAQGGWTQYTVPISAFNCEGGGIQLSDLTQFEFENESSENVEFCLADLEIVR